MNPIKSFDGRNIRVNIVRDKCPEHPFNSTDAPIRVYNEGGNRLCFWRNHEKEGLPYRDSSISVLYFDSDIDAVQSREFAVGALSLDILSWQAYCGWKDAAETRPRAKKDLESYRQELQAWANGEVFGFTSVKTFVKKGHTYETTQEASSGSCFGFYGKSGLLAIADYMPTKALKRAVRSWARRY